MDDLGCGLVPLQNLVASHELSVDDWVQRKDSGTRVQILVFFLYEVPKPRQEHFLLVLASEKNEEQEALEDVN